MPDRKLIHLALLPVLLLVGCSTPDIPTGGGSAVTRFPDDPESAWEYEGGGKYVEGVGLECAPNAGSFGLEDLEMVNEFVGETPVTSMVFNPDGTFSYATGWPDEIVGTGVTSGAGSYGLDASEDQNTVILRGDATVIWHDAETGESTEQPDSVEIVFTRVPAPDYCVS